MDLFSSNSIFIALMVVYLISKLIFKDFFKKHENIIFIIAAIAAFIFLTYLIFTTHDRFVIVLTIALAALIGFRIYKNKKKTKVDDDEPYDRYKSN